MSDDFPDIDGLREAWEAEDAAYEAWRDNLPCSCEFCDHEADGVCEACLRPMCDSGDCGKTCEDCHGEQRYCHECSFAWHDLWFCRTHYVLQRMQDLRESLIASGHIRPDGTLPMPADWAGV